MVAKIGKKLIQGAKEELQKDPPKLFDTENVSELIEGILTVGLIGMVIFGLSRRSKPAPVTVIVNNYINGVLQQ